MKRAIALRRIAAGCIGGLVLLACGFYIARTFQWREAFALLSDADLVWFLVGSGTAIVAFWIVRSMRWYLLLRGMQAEVRFTDLYLCSAVALSLSAFTPLQSGELLKVELLKKYGQVGRMPGYSAFLVERVADLYVVAVIGVVALAALSGSPLHATLLVGMSIAVPLAGYFVLHKVRLPGRMGQFLDHLQAGISTPATLLVLLLSTFVSWAVIAMGWQACFISLSIGLDFTDLFGVLSVVTLASILSFIPGGLGVAEVSTAELLIRHGISAPQAQAGALMLRAFSLLVIVLGAIHWLLLRARRSRRYT